MTAQVLEHINAITAQMVYKFGEEQKEKPYRIPTIPYVQFEIAEGKKYYKVILITAGQSRSVHAFVDKNTGEMYKPASWLKPAKHVRFRLLDPQSLAQCLHRCDWAGSYLYM